ncbi:glycosyltransferase family 4 protein [Paenibacillus xerothermodurans]|nr:glycosyltransferase family 4 protein [Paenibacillus xerothermodurans]
MGSEVQSQFVQTLQRMMDVIQHDSSEAEIKKMIKSLKSIERMVKENGYQPQVIQQIFVTTHPLNKRRKKKVWSRLLEFLIHDPVPLPVDEKLIKAITTVMDGNVTWDTIRVRWYSEQNKLQELYAVLDKYPVRQRVGLLQYLAKQSFKQNDLKNSLLYAEEAYSIHPTNPTILRRLISLHHRMGNISQRLNFIEQLSSKSNKLLPNEYQMAMDEYKLTQEKWVWTHAPHSVPRGNVILHALNKSYPEINGYSVRSAEIVNHQQEAGLHPVIVTKLGWSPVESMEFNTCETIGNVDYYRLLDDRGSQLNKVPLISYFSSYAKQFADFLLRVQPRVVHAASNFQNALAPIMVAQRMGIPTVYEVRGMWHDTQSSKTPGFEGSERYRMHEDYEIYTCNMADQVVTISEALRTHLINKGVNPLKIEVIPNGVDVEKFNPVSPNLYLKNKYGLDGNLVIGFIGSLEVYEGIEFILHAIHQLIHAPSGKQYKIKMLIVGEGPALAELRRLTSSLGLTHSVHFVGKVPRSEVVQYYSVIDVFPFPRRKFKVCELVTPLKPYEAMAMAKIVLVSDIPALREIIIDKQTGIVFEAENVQSLVEAIRTGMDHPHIRWQAREWIVHNRDWKKLVKRYNDIYDRGCVCEAGGNQDAPKP